MLISRQTIKMKRTILHILALILIMLWPVGVSGQLLPLSPKREMRAVWLTTLSGLDWPHTRGTSRAVVEQQKQELREILDTLSAAGFNTVILQTRVRATVIYPSQIEPWDGCFSGRVGQAAGFDPLAFAVDEAHKRNMQLHAWLVAVPSESAQAAKALGQQAMNKRVPDLCLRTNEGWMLNPGVPEAANYLASLCAEVTRRYDIDGISLDYIRYPEKEVRYNDLPTYYKYAGESLRLTEWRRECLNRCVKAVHDSVKALKPWVMVSCSPIGKYADTNRYPSGGWNAYAAVYQDARLWLNNGWMDMLMPMMYFRGNHYFPFALDWVEQAPPLSVATGLGAYMLDSKQKNWPLNDIEQEILFSRRHNMGGQVFFRSRFVTDNTKGLLTLLKYGLYRSPALVPAVPTARTMPAVPAPTNARVVETDSATTLLWSGVEGCAYILYRSNSYPVDTSLSSNLFITNLRDTTYTLRLPIPRAWLLFYSVTAIDRYGRESAPLPLNSPVLIQKKAE